MKQEIIEIVKPLLEKGTAGLLQAADLIKAQAPELCAQILKYNFWYSIFVWGVATFALLLMSSFFIICIYRYIKDIGDEDVIVPCMVCSGIVSLIFGLFYFVAILDGIAFIKIWLAPKLYLIEYISSLVK